MDKIPEDQAVQSNPVCCTKITVQRGNEATRMSEAFWREKVCTHFLGEDVTDHEVLFVT